MMIAKVLGFFGAAGIALVGCGEAADETACRDTCAQVGGVSCGADGKSLARCERQADGCLSETLTACGEQAVCQEATCVPCSGAAGTYRNQRFEMTHETRFYYLYVPAEYACNEAWPLLVDLHGTAGATPEEAYGLDGARASARQEGFILLRPRSRSSLEGGSDVYRWDQNAGDPERNREFINALVADLGLRYHLDASRMYVMGFSSGTNQTAEALADASGPFSGFGFVGGGAWTIDAIAHPDVRYYLNTGHRDYMMRYQITLLDLLEQAGVTAAQVWRRQSDTGHDLYDWMYPELWAFLDRGELPEVGVLNAGWQQESQPSTETLLAAQTLLDGTVLAVGEAGVSYRRAATTGVWSASTMLGTPASDLLGLTGLCVFADGTGLAVGQASVARTEDAGVSWVWQPLVPDLDSGFGYGFLNDIACSTHRAVGVGYWVGAATDDLGDSWENAPIATQGGYSAQGAAVAVAPWGTWLAVGYYQYLGRSQDGLSFTQGSVGGAESQWFNDVTPVSIDTWVLVGEQGLIARSTNDGRTFTVVQSAAPGADLYAVRFRDEQVGLAVGLDGTAFLTTDAGQSFSPCHAGVAQLLADVVWLADGQALVVGEAGLVLRLDPSLCPAP